MDLLSIELIVYFTIYFLEGMPIYEYGVLISTHRTGSALKWLINYPMSNGWSVCHGMFCPLKLT